MPCAEEVIATFPLCKPLPKTGGEGCHKPNELGCYSFCVSHKCHSQSITPQMPMCGDFWEAQSSAGFLFCLAEWGQGALRESGSAAVLPAGRAARADAAPRFSLLFFPMGPGIKNPVGLAQDENTQKNFIWKKKKKRMSLRW